jgi:membrane protein DedA with SNARE-associated domain
MIAKIITILSGFIVAQFPTMGYIRHRSFDGHRVGLHTAAFGDHHAVFRLSGVSRRDESLVGWRGGAVGCVLGSLVAYWVGMYGGRPFIEKYGKYILLSRHDLDIADRWFAKHGEVIVFVSRLLPAIRTFIAFPAGVARMNLTRFVIYTFAGSLPWCLALAYVGQKLGEQWDKDDTLKTWFHRFDFLIGIAGALFVAWWVWRHIKHSRPLTDFPTVTREQVLGVLELMRNRILTEYETAA